MVCTLGMLRKDLIDSFFVYMPQTVFFSLSSTSITIKDKIDFGHSLVVEISQLESLQRNKCNNSDKC